MIKESKPSRDNLPNMNDYLPATIRKKVVNVGIKHPATLYPIALGSSSAIAGLFLGFPVLYIAAFASIFLGSVWAIIQIFFLYEKIGSTYIQHLNERQKEYGLYVKTLLEKDLNACRSVKEIEAYAEEGIRQLSLIQEKLANVRSLLKIKLHHHELAFGRFFGAAEQVALIALNNLKNIVNLLKSAGTIRPIYIQRSLNKLAMHKPQTHEDIKQSASLESRLLLREYQLRRVSSLLIKNEETITEMERISSAVADWQTNKSRLKPPEFESAITHLYELAARARNHN